MRSNMRMKQFALTAASICLATASAAEFRYADGEQVQYYVENNIISVFYHELGHALVHYLELPIYGQEEDAADTLSTYMMHAIWEEESAQAIAYSTAEGYRIEAALYEPDLTGMHGPDAQRLMNHVCIFYGGDPEARAGFAADFELPEDRAETCVEEFQMAAYSWGTVLENIENTDGAQTFRLGRTDTATEAGRLITDIMVQEVADMNKFFRLPETLVIHVEACGEANAFYDPEVREILMCVEYADDLALNAPS